MSDYLVGKDFVKQVRVALEGNAGGGFQVFDLDF